MESRRCHASCCSHSCSRCKSGKRLKRHRLICSLARPSKARTPQYACTTGQVRHPSQHDQPLPLHVHPWTQLLHTHTKVSNVNQRQKQTRRSCNTHTHQLTGSHYCSHRTRSAAGKCPWTPRYNTLRPRQIKVRCRDPPEAPIDIQLPHTCPRAATCHPAPKSAQAVAHLLVQRLAAHLHRLVVLPLVP